MLKLMLALLMVTLYAGQANSYPAYGHYLEHRSVIYFAPSQDSMVKSFLKGVLINNCQLKERDIVTIVITEDGYTVPQWFDEAFNIESVANIYQIPEGSHTAILIGKDGEEKHRWDGETNWQGLTDLIDEMPMRKQEMQRRASHCNI